MTDERRILTLIARRLRRGAEQYGRFDLARDRRDFRAEALEELLDAVIYLAAALLQRDTRLRCAGCREAVGEASTSVAVCCTGLHFCSLGCLAAHEEED